jgi:hypothetical protein
MEECNGISVVTEFMVGRRFGSRCGGGALVHAERARLSVAPVTSLVLG